MTESDLPAAIPCGVQVSHRVFITAPPGYGSIMDCPGNHHHGYPVTVDSDGTLRILDGNVVRRD